jgi:predicted small lipoprotein YifL
MRRLLSLNSFLLISFCVAAGALAGCGQKGPLYLPPATKPAPAPASSTVKPKPAIDADNILPNNERPASAQS